MCRVESMCCEQCNVLVIKYCVACVQATVMMRVLGAVIMIHRLFAPGPIRSQERMGPGAKRLGTMIMMTVCVESSGDHRRRQRRPLRNAAVHLHWQSSESGQDGRRPPCCR